MVTRAPIDPSSDL